MSEPCSTAAVAGGQRGDRRRLREQGGEPDHEREHAGDDERGDHADGDLAGDGEHRADGHATELDRLEPTDLAAGSVGEAAHDQADGRRGERAVGEAGTDAAGDEPLDRIAHGVHHRRHGHHHDRAVDHQALTAAVGVRGDEGLGDERGDEAGRRDPSELRRADVGTLLQRREQGEHHHERGRDGERARFEGAHLSGRLAFPGRQGRAVGSSVGGSALC